MNRLAELWRAYRRWREDAENPSPIKRLDDLPVPPGHEALIFEEYGDPLDPQTRPEWPPAGPTSAYPQANEKKTGDDGGDES